MPDPILTRPRTPDDPPDTSPKPRRSWISALPATVLRQPYLAGNTLIAGGVVIALLLGFGVRNTFVGLATGDPQAIMVVAMGATALLTASTALAVMKTLAEGSAKDRTFTDTTARSGKAIHLLARRLDDMNAKLDDIGDGIARTVALDRSVWLRRPNDDGVWAGLEPGTPYVTIGGRCVGDVVRRRDADGQEFLQAKSSRMRALLARFAAGTRLSSVSHVHFVDDAASAVGCETVLLQLASYRGVVKQAERDGVAVDLSAVRFYLVAERDRADSFFIGTRAVKSHDQERIAFLLRYNHGAFAGLTNPLTWHVESTSAPDLVTAFTGIARDLMARAGKEMSLAEAERRFGHLLPAVELDTPAPAGARPAARAVGEIIDLGDGHFVI